MVTLNGATVQNKERSVHGSYILSYIVNCKIRESNQGDIKMKKTISIGDISNDIRAFVPSFAQTNVEKEIIYLCEVIGGAPAFFAVAASVLRFRSSILSKIGDDDMGKHILKVLEKNNINTSHIKVESNASTMRFITIYDKGFNRHLYFYRGNLGLNSKDITKDAIKNNDIIVICPTSIEAAKKAAKLGKEYKKLVVFDPSGVFIDSGLEKLKETLYHVDILLVNEFEAKKYTQKSKLDICAKLLLQYGPSIVIITRGKFGCIIADNTHFFKIPAFSIDVKDPTGAGDCFVAGFLYKYLEINDLFEAGNFANAVSALRTTKNYFIEKPFKFPEIVELYQDTKRKIEEG